MRYVSWNLVNCCPTVRKIPFEKVCSRWMTKWWKRHSVKRQCCSAKCYGTRCIYESAERRTWTVTVLDPGPMSPAMGLSLFCEHLPDASLDLVRLICSVLAMEFLMKSMLCSSATGGYQQESRMSQPRVMFGRSVSFRFISSMVRRNISIRCIPYCSHICRDYYRNMHTLISIERCVFIFLYLYFWIYRIEPPIWPVC